MTLRVEQLPDTAPAPSTNGAGRSVVDRIRARHEASQGAKTIDLPVPGYEPEKGKPSDLGVRYRPLRPEDLARLEKVAVDTQVETRIKLHIDSLIAACECILIRNERGEFTPLLIDGEPVYFDDRLAGWFGEELDTAREIVLTVFSTLPEAYVGAIQHAEKIQDWMNGESEVGQERLLGES